MKLFAFLCGRGPQNPKKVPFAPPRLPFRLRDKVSCRKFTSGEKPCVEEVQNLIIKLGNNDFNEKFCQKEIQALRTVQKVTYEKTQKETAESKSGVIKTGRDLNPNQLNRYLKKFPVVKKNPFESS